MRREEKIYRMFDILVELNNAHLEGKKTLEEVAEAMGMSEQKLLSDIKLLRRALPTGKGVEYAMLGFDIIVEEDDKQIKKMEASYLEKPNYTYVALNHGEYDAVRKFAKKQGIELLLDGDELYKQHREFHQYTPVNRENFLKIRTAICCNRKITFNIKGTDEVRTLFPMMIYENAAFGYTYVIGSWRSWRKKKTIYRLDRMENITITKEVETNRNEEDEEKLKQRLYSVWGSGDGEAEVEFKVFKDARDAGMQKVKRDLETYIRHAGYQTHEDEDGNLIVTGTVIGVSDFERYIRSCGAAVEVIRPQKLRDSIIESAKQRIRDLENQN